VFHTVKDPHSNYLSNTVLENRNAQDLLPPGFHLPPCALISHVQKASAQIWHARYGHLSYRNMEKPLKKTLVHGMNVDPKELHNCIGDLCEECTRANAKTKPSPTSDSPPSTQMLQILHTDLMGPVATSYNGRNYIMTVMDDYYKLASVVTMKSYDEAHAYLIHICNQLENQTGLKIKATRSDNGGDYINAAVAKFTSGQGIDPQHSAPYMPQSNGSAENLNFKLQA
jgi:hypothetical protein